MVFLKGADLLLEVFQTVVKNSTGTSLARAGHSGRGAVQADEPTKLLWKLPERALQICCFPENQVTLCLSLLVVLPLSADSMRFGRRICDALLRRIAHRAEVSLKPTKEFPQQPTSKVILPVQRLCEMGPEMAFGGVHAHPGADEDRVHEVPCHQVQRPGKKRTCPGSELGARSSDLGVLCCGLLGHQPLSNFTLWIPIN